MSVASDGVVEVVVVVVDNGANVDGVAIVDVAATEEGVVVVDVTLATSGKEASLEMCCDSS